MRAVQVEVIIGAGRTVHIGGEAVHRLGREKAIVRDIEEVTLGLTRSDIRRMCSATLGMQAAEAGHADV
jgi:hypothetical protein